MSEQSSFAPGDDVLVAWGLDDVAGRVVSTNVRSDRVYVDVEVEFPDSEEAEVVTVPSSAVRERRQYDKDLHSISGRWLDAFHYQEELGKALDRVLSGRSTLDAVQHNVRANDSGVDFVASLEDGTMLAVEAKKFASPTSHNVQDAVSQLAAFIASLANSKSPRIRGLVVFGSSGDAVGRVGRVASPEIAVSYWQGPDDDDALRASLTELLA